jgi:sugar lactone lactonase YvrE
MYGSVFGLLLLFMLLSGAPCAAERDLAKHPAAASANLVEVASFPTTQPTGVAVSRQGRIFVNFPRWRDEHNDSVVEVLPNGDIRPFPDQTWNRWDPSQSPDRRFVCVQSVYVDQNDFLWILDPASPKFAGVVPVGAKLVKVDLSKNRVIRVIPFGEVIAPRQSYLNDVRVDVNRNFAYLTDSGLGALIVVNLATGQARRVLDSHPSTRAEPGLRLIIGGEPWVNDQGQTPQVHADGIALDYAGRFLYYHALTGKTLYRIDTQYLRDETLPASALEKHVENLGDTGAVDGLAMDRQNNVYLSVLEKNAVMRRRPDGRIETLVRNDRVLWPDSFAVGFDGWLYFTISQIHLMPQFNRGKDRRTSPYKILKINIGTPRWK